MYVFKEVSCVGIFHDSMMINSKYVFVSFYQTSFTCLQTERKGRNPVCLCSGQLWWSYHSNSVTGQQRWHVQNHVVGHIGQQVDDGHYRHGNCNGQRQIPATTSTWFQFQFRAVQSMFLCSSLMLLPWQQTEPHISGTISKCSGFTHIFNLALHKLSIWGNCQILARTL